MKALLAFALLIVGLGCSSEPVEPPITDSPPLAGTPAKELVGSWKLVSGGVSTITLKEDGTCQIVSEANSPGGKMKSDISGEWSVDNEKLHVRRQGTDKLFFTAVYVYKLNGSKLELSREGSKTLQTYERGKP